MSKFFKEVFLSSLVFSLLWSIATSYVIGFFFPVFNFIADLALCTLCLLIVFDVWLLFKRCQIIGTRIIAPRLSNGDDNQVNITISNLSSIPTEIEVIDEVPAQFQVRETSYALSLHAMGSKNISYILHPTERGEYGFGYLNIYVKTPLKLIIRKFQCSAPVRIPVYPSYIQMKKFELIAFASRWNELGIKKTRRIGQSFEFEQISDYVQGDDIRSINWKATARQTKLMVNKFDEEKSQNVYSIINTGRIMKMPFDKLSLLDYSVNSALVLSNISLQKQDKAGLITFADKIHSALPAESGKKQLQKILESLYNIETRFPEADYERLCAFIYSKINHRSLIFLYTNFETKESLMRQVKLLTKIAQRHILVVIIFENTELAAMLNSNSSTSYEIYEKIIAEKMIADKKAIIAELWRHKIHCIYCKPSELTVDIINKYLEIKTRQII
ncbi:MAG: DUF58 domain-containing protein [Ignavibacteria bacterium]|nr:DUF58 domain-containing protein [Ignavibacteria bacterium]